MAFNPMNLLKLKSTWDDFNTRHPKFAAFLVHLTKDGIKEDYIIDVKITTPDGREISSNMKVTREDLDMINSFK